MDMLAVSAWTSEDELLNKAIVADTSLEAKGTFQFSQRLTFQEQEDRRHHFDCHANASVEPSSYSIERVDSASTLSPKLHILEYKGEKSAHKRKMNDDVPNYYNLMLKRVETSMFEDRDNTQSTNYMYGKEKQNHSGSPVSDCEFVQQHLAYFETVSPAAALTPINVTKYCELEEVGHSVAKEGDQPSKTSMLKLYEYFCSQPETLVESDETSLSYAGNVGDSFTLQQIPTQNTYKSIYEPTFSESQVKEKESAVNYADFYSAGDAKNSHFLDCDVHSDAMDKIPYQYMDNFSPSTDANLEGSSAPFMNLGELEEFLFTDKDENDAANIPNLDSFLLDFTWEENIANLEHTSIPGGGACPVDDVSYGQFINCSSESTTLSSIPAANLELPTCVSDIHISPSEPAANNTELYIACSPEARLSVPAANAVVHISCVPEAQITPSKPNADPEICDEVICCVLHTEDTEIPCNDDALVTLSSSCRRRSGSSSKKFQFLGIKGYHLARARIKEESAKSETIQSKKGLYKDENIKETPNSSRTIQIKKKALYTAETVKETPDSSETIQIKNKALYTAENIKETPDSSKTIESKILSELGINLPFIKRGD